MTINGQIILHFSNSALLYFVIIGGNVLEQFSIECRKITKDKDNAKKKLSEPVTIGFVENLKWYCDENYSFPMEPILKHKQVACMTRKMLFTIFKYLFSFQRYLSF